MNIQGTRFGDITILEERLLTFPRGIVGLPAETSFVLLEREGRRIAWLQSTKTPSFALPVIDGGALGPDYPLPSAEELARAAGLPTNDLIVLVVTVARVGQPILANLLAPIVVDTVTRLGAQHVLDPNRYSATAPLPLDVFPPSPVSRTRIGYPPIESATREASVELKTP